MKSALSPQAVYRLADRHRRLQTRRFELLPLRGEGAAFTDTQGRGWGTNPTTSPTELVDLISSIAVVGQLQPVLVEELPNETRRMVSGERRLRAMKWGSVNHPDNEHFTAISAVIVDGPLSDEERRSWQLIENLARTDLQPGELAAALLYERCALLTSRLLLNNVTVPTGIATLDDPIARFDALDKLRRNADLHTIGAPWSEVIARIGIQLSEDKAKKLVTAFRAIPPEISSEMDNDEVSLHSRMEFLKLHRGRTDAAEGIWAALRNRTGTEPKQLLTRSVTEAFNHPEADPDDLIDAAEAFHQAANASRGRQSEPTRGSKSTGGSELTTPYSNDTATEISTDHLTQCRTTLNTLLDQLRAGATLNRYDAGSLRLQLSELDQHLAQIHTPRQPFKKTNEN